MKIIILLAIIIAVAIIMPCATIWSLNALFPALAIPLTVETWMAAIVLGGVVSGNTMLSFGGKK